MSVSGRMVEDLYSKPDEDMDEQPIETVNHPKHYNSHPSGVEAIDVVERLSFNLGNALKYLWRLDHKGRKSEDAKKALWYLEREYTYCRKHINAEPEELAILIGKGLESVRKTCSRVVMMSEPGSPLRHVLKAIYNADKFYDENVLDAIEIMKRYIEETKA